MVKKKNINKKEKTNIEVKPLNILIAIKKVENPNITKPKDMNMIEFAGAISFYPGAVIQRKLLEEGQVYHIDDCCGSLKLKYNDELSLPEKVYDFDKGFREQILKTLRSTEANNNIGVLLEGYKGQGKSVMAKLLAKESGLPVVLINSPIDVKQDLISFLSNITQDYVLFIDEFEKLFAESSKNIDGDKAENFDHTQEVFLSLLDGTVGLYHKRLVIFTTNNEINDKFINRPGRIRYYKKYNSMPKELFDQILEDKLRNKAYKQDLIDNIDALHCSIDVLASIIEEINVQDKPYSEFKDFFNHIPEKITYSRYRKDGDEWKWIDTTKQNKELNPNNVQLDYLLQRYHSYNYEITFFDGNTIYYTATVEKNDDMDFPNKKKIPKNTAANSEKKIIKYKIEKESFSSKHGDVF